ncbi:diphosphate--fructose-6-phosphate 1-phosphotransferase [Calycomorphotria hydatis]|uniref:Pyrophosphate--fructose 6-phosphate 1-phosphotransferase n=1 Tax=Calycomorphotria hydatis TaxID=2528027 RepID=A0A517TCW2_9PLAN|nr:diphosphate--fructose-6-phosphate 1-phosphotransferase [Calycomorphotria hydatis]QDT66207.1 6-phosphofructokinase 1 [Calycomorphotria hydatis]
MSNPRNLIVAQSGGPSPVINNSLRGLINTARDYDQIGTIYAGWHGIEGVLKEELLNLSEQDPQEISLLRTTPAAGSIGTCRYRLNSEYTEDLDRLVDVFKAHNIGYFCYIGGNDSMETAQRVAEVAEERNLDLVSMGVPKTIYNDLGDPEFKLIDHTPGYGSVARYWTHNVQLANEENRGSYPTEPVLVMQAMCRQIGFVPAAARLADPHRELPLLIYLAERKVTLEQIADQINDKLRFIGRAIVVVSEGLQIGDLEEPTDSFGRPEYGAGSITVAQQLINALNQRGLAVKGAARANVPGTDQRHNMLYASAVDLQEAYRVGQKAAMLAAEGNNGFMSTILREPGPVYDTRFGSVPLADVATKERSFPLNWISECGTDVTDEFIKYAQPIIGQDHVSVPVVDGRLRMTRFKPIFADQVLDPYIPQAMR